MWFLIATGTSYHTTSYTLPLPPPPPHTHSHLLPTHPSHPFSQLHLLLPPPFPSSRFQSGGEAACFSMSKAQREESSTSNVLANYIELNMNMPSKQALAAANR